MNNKVKLIGGFLTLLFGLSFSIITYGITYPTDNPTDLSDMNHDNQIVTSNQNTTTYNLKRMVNQLVSAEVSDTAKSYFYDDFFTNSGGWIATNNSGGLTNTNYGLLFVGNPADYLSGATTTIEAPLAKPISSNNFQAHFSGKRIDFGGKLNFVVGTNQTNGNFCSLTGGYGLSIGDTDNKVSLYKNGCNEIASSTFSVINKEGFIVDLIKQGTRIRVIINGNTLIDYTDASPLDISSSGNYVGLNTTGCFQIGDINIRNPTTIAYVQFPTISTFNIVTEGLESGLNFVKVKTPLALNTRKYENYWSNNGYYGYLYNIRSSSYKYDFNTIYSSGGVNYATNYYVNNGDLKILGGGIGYGETGNGLSLDGVNSGVLLVNPFTYTNIISPMFSFRFKTISDNIGLFSICESDNTCSNGIKTYIKNGSVYFNNSAPDLSGAYVKINSNGSISDGNWHSISMIMNSSLNNKFEFNIDGVKTTVSISGVGVNYNYYKFNKDYHNYVKIGNVLGFNNFKGDIDEFFWDNFISNPSYSNSILLTEKYNESRYSSTNYSYYYDTTPSNVLNFNASFSGGVNGEKLNWDYNYTPKINNIISSNDNFSLYARTKLSYNEYDGNLYGTPYVISTNRIAKLDKALNIKSYILGGASYKELINYNGKIIGLLNGKIDEISKITNTITSSYPGITSTSYTRMLYVNNFGKYGKNLLLTAPSGSGYTLLNPDNYSLTYTGNWNTDYGLSTIKDVAVANNNLYALTTDNYLHIIDLNSKKELYKIFIDYSADYPGYVNNYIASDGKILYLNIYNSVTPNSNGKILSLILPNTFDVLRDTGSGYNSLGVVSGTGYTDNITDSSIPGLVSVNNSLTTLNGNGVLTNFIINPPTGTGININYKIRTISPSGLSNTSLPQAVSTTSAIEGYEVLWKKENTIIENASPKINNTSSTISIPVIPNGTYYAHIRAKSKNGLWGSTSVVGPYLLNTTPAVINNANISNKSYTANSTINITFDSDVKLNSSSTSISVNGTILSNSITETLKTDGTGYRYSIPFTPTDETTRYYVIVNAVDLSGLTSTINFNFGKVNGWVQVLGSVASNNGVILNDYSNQREKGILGEISAPDTVGVSSGSNVVINRGDGYKELQTTLSGSRYFIDFNTVYGTAPNENKLLSSGKITGNVEFLNGYVYTYTSIDDTKENCLHIGESSGTGTIDLSYHGQGTISVNGAVCIDGNIVADKNFDSDKYSSLLDINATGNIYINPNVKNISDGVLLKTNGNVYSGTKGG